MTINMNADQLLNALDAVSMNATCEPDMRRAHAKAANELRAALNRPRVLSLGKHHFVGETEDERRARIGKALENAKCVLEAWS